MGNDMNDPFSNMTQMWLQMAANAAQAWQPAAGSTASPEMFRKGRADLMQIWSDWCEQLMRSSAFLEAQKQCMGGSLAVRKQVRANLRQVLLDSLRHLYLYNLILLQKFSKNPLE